jgi:hypothetical protein
VNKFNGSIESKNCIFNCGKKIKDIFIEFRKDIIDTNPFNNQEIYNSQYFENIISNFEGNHMSYNILPIQILETCVADNNNKPFMLLKTHAIKCLDKLFELLVSLINHLQKETINYPQLSKYMVTFIVEKILLSAKSKSISEINNVFLYQESYIWTDDEKFKNVLYNIKTMDNNYIIKLLISYYDSIKVIICDIVPKLLMTNIIRYLESNLLGLLIQDIVTDEKLGLLKEDDNIEKQRKYYNSLHNKILLIKKHCGDNKIMDNL